MFIYYTLLKVLDFCDFDLKFDIFQACMYFDFYKLYVMVDSNLLASGVDSELYYTDASTCESLYALSRSN